MIRVGVAASSAILRAGLETLLRSSSALEVLPGSTDLAALAAWAEQHSPDVVVAALGPAEEDLPPPLLALASPARSPAVILLADDPAPPWTADALRAGVRAVLPREPSAAEIVAAVEAAAAGLVVLHPQDLDQVLAAVPQNPRDLPGEAPQALTPREIEVLRMLAEGLGNKTIAWRLGISEHTVKFHVAAIMSKLHAATRTEAVTLGIRRGLILI
ncbi:MAG TPA: response regulator transcription factor [Bryobacteraceae bacterium]|nr:response regulator transcription factor [Bryobacteraceae bacterium]